MQVALDELLSEDAAARRASERRAFDQLSRGRDIVLMGAGGLGRRTLHGLRHNGVEPLAFADNTRDGSVIDGLRVLTPEAAAREFRSRAAFVVTIWGANRPHRFAHSRAQLESLGCDVVCPFPPLFWKYPEPLLPFYLQDLPSRVLDAAPDVRRAFDVWEDDASRAEYLAQVRFRLHADFDQLPHPVDHPQYFPTDLFDWADDERIVDGGAFDGDSIRTITALHGDRFGHVLSVEPDPVNFAALQATVAALPRAARSKVECRQVALAAARGRSHLDPTGTASSRVGPDPAAGSVSVTADTIDALVEGCPPTFIKLDLEGAEIGALQGARDTIDRHAPILAVCVYHLQDHLWTIPMMLRQWRDDYALFLRPHNEEGWDLVCYAVPRARLATGGR